LIVKLGKESRHCKASIYLQLTKSGLLLIYVPTSPMQTISISIVNLAKEDEKRAVNLVAVIQRSDATQDAAQ